MAGSSPTDKLWLDGQFESTHWTVVLAAGDTSSPHASAALERLCRTYWYPMYAWVRRRGYAEADAQDLTQSFFARLLEKKHLKRVDRDGGRFRSFLLTSLSHFLADEWHKARALKRGGETPIFSLDAEEAEQRYRQEPSGDLSADKLLERRWALTTLECALGRLQEEYASDGKARQFELLHPLLAENVPDGAYEKLGEQLGVSAGAASVALCRMRKRYREFVRAEVGRAVADPAEINSEMEALLAALRPPA